MRLAVSILLGILLANPLQAMEIEGITLDDSITLAGKTLQLNGAGIRTKFFFDIYIGALYLPSKTTEADKAMSLSGPKRVSMHFLYSEVEKEKLIEAWDAGFAYNQSAETIKNLTKRLQQFNDLFVTAHRGDSYLFDFLENGSTKVTRNGKQVGSIAGKDFQQALLSVWLGDDPADNYLKASMLGAAY